MLIAEILKPESIALDLHAETKREALTKVLELVKRNFTKFEKAEILKVLVERESLSSTACDKYIAIPHARLETNKNFVSAIGRFKEGLNFDSFDQEKTYILFLLLGPKDRPGEYLKLLAKISKFLKDPECKKILLTSDKIEEIFTKIKNFNGQ